MARPHRLEVFDLIRQTMEQENILHALELGSGPGFLAEHLCQRIPGLALELFDFSPAMHELARRRCEKFLDRISFVAGNFKHEDWTAALGSYRCILCNQTVHELRHKRHALRFHREVKSLLKPNGIYLMCDHVHGKHGMQNEELYMHHEEQIQTLQEAGFSTKVLLHKGSLQLIKAIN